MLLPPPMLPGAVGIAAELCLHNERFRAAVVPGSMSAFQWEDLGMKGHPEHRLFTWTVGAQVTVKINTGKQACLLLLLAPPPLLLTLLGVGAAAAAAAASLVPQSNCPSLRLPLLQMCGHRARRPRRPMPRMRRCSCGSPAATTGWVMAQRLAATAARVRQRR